MLQQKIYGIKNHLNRTIGIILLSLVLMLLPKITLAQQSDTSPQHTLTGSIEIHSQFVSKYLSSKRDLIIYLPPNYQQETTRRYAVLYLHDGQNLFDGATSFIQGQEWQCDETAQRLILAHTIEPIIIVGIYNTGNDRIDEYTPTADAKYNKGGKADLYGQLLVNELKPFIDAHYRTLTDREHTALGGSSLGGLVSIYLGIKYADVFGKLAVISPSVWWDKRSILDYIKRSAIKPNTRIWIDIGTEEDEEGVGDTKLLQEALIAKGWQNDKNLKCLIVKGAKHNEQAWSQRFDQILGFLFPVK